MKLWIKLVIGFVVSLVVPLLNDKLWNFSDMMFIEHYLSLAGIYLLFIEGCILSWHNQMKQLK